MLSYKKSAIRIMSNEIKTQSFPMIRPGRLIKHLGPWLPLVAIIANYIPALLAIYPSIQIALQVLWCLFRINQHLINRKTVQQRSQYGTYHNDQPEYQRKRQRICIKSITTLLSGFCFSNLILTICKCFSIPVLECVNVFSPFLAGLTVSYYGIITVLFSACFGLYLGACYYRYQRFLLDKKVTAQSQRCACSNNRSGFLQSIRMHFFSEEHLLTRYTAHWINGFINNFYLITACILFLSGHPIQLATLGQIWILNQHVNSDLLKYQVVTSLILTAITTIKFNRYKPMSDDYICHKVAEIARISWVKELQQFTSETPAEERFRNNMEKQARASTILRF